MESSPEEVALASYSSSSTGTVGDGYAAAGVFTKRKRTKRLRALPSPPPPLPRGNTTVEEDSYFSTATTTEEEEDMANCLILLARGRRTDQSRSPREDKFTSRKFTETVTTAGAKAGFYVYECRTCSKCFPSFQALGGHRASHKKPRQVGPANSVTASGGIRDRDDGGDGLDIRMSSFAGRSSPPAGARLRVHECSVCGSEFASGQALGGHMRRHRPVGPAAAAVAPASDVVASGVGEEIKKGSNSMLSLDLNLPAPSEENMAFAFIDQRPMALVDCHY